MSPSDFLDCDVGGTRPRSPKLVPTSECRQWLYMWTAVKLQGLYMLAMLKHSLFSVILRPYLYRKQNKRKIYASFRPKNVVFSAPKTTKRTKFGRPLVRPAAVCLTVLIFSCHAINLSVLPVPCLLLRGMLWAQSWTVTDD